MNHDTIDVEPISERNIKMFNNKIILYQFQYRWIKPFALAGQACTLSKTSMITRSLVQLYTRSAEPARAMQSAAHFADRGTPNAVADARDGHAYVVCLVRRAA